MKVPINHWAVLVAAVVSMVLGGIWYGPIFGKIWTELSGFTKEKMDEARARGMGKSYAGAFIGSLLMSYVLAHAIVFAGAYMKMRGIGAGLMSGFWNWVGFIAPVTLGTVLWEGKPWKLWFINNGYNLLSLLIMGIILSLWR